MLFEYWQETKLSADLVIPVPLHPSRQRERGFNQAGLLASVLAERAGLPLNDVQLSRTRATPPQVGLGAEERKANVQDAFTWRGSGLEGLRILLIDDVCTTGATLEACAVALAAGGAKSVWALTLARPRELSS
jgi:ComF family protein